MNWLATNIKPRWGIINYEFSILNFQFSARRLASFLKY